MSTSASASSASTDKVQSGVGAASALERATAAKDAGNEAFKAGGYEGAITQYKQALRILAADAGPKAFGAGASVLVRPPPGGSTSAPQTRQRNGGLRYAMVMCDDPNASTVDVEYLPSALADSAGGDQAAGEEEDDVNVTRCEPLYDSATGAAALQLSLHMNWARCLKELKRPNDGLYFVHPHCLAARDGCTTSRLPSCRNLESYMESCWMTAFGLRLGAKRANVAVALAEADRARTVLANSDRIAGTTPVEVPTAGLVKAIYLRAQCLVRNSRCCSHKLDHIRFFSMSVCWP